MTDTQAQAGARWLTDKYILVMLLVFPLFTGFDGYHRITLSKLLYLVAATGLWLAGLLIFLCRGLRPRLRRWRLPLWLVGAFWLWACLSAALSPYGAVTLLGAGRYDGLLTLSLYVIALLGVARLARPRERYVHALGVAVTGCCGVALLQLYGLDPLDLYPNGWTYLDYGVRYSSRFLGTVGNTVPLSSVLALALPVFMLTAVRRRGRCLWLLLPTALALYVLLRAECSSALLALAAGTALALPLLTESRVRRRWLLAAEAVLALALLVVIYRWPGGDGPMYEASRLLHGQLSDSFGSSRVRIWRAVLDVVPARPLLGGGPGTVALRIDIQFSRFVPETGETLRTYVDNAHNEYLTWLADLGVPGLLLYLAAMAATVCKKRRWRGEGACWGAGLLCCWIQGLFGLGLCLSAPLLWIGWGLFLSEKMPENEEKP